MQYPNHSAPPPTVSVGPLERCTIVLALLGLLVWLVTIPVAALVLSAVVGGIAVLAMLAAVSVIATIETVLAVYRFRNRWSVHGHPVSTVGV